MRTWAQPGASPGEPPRHYTLWAFPGPVGEALVQVALDCSGRPHPEFDPKLRSRRIGRYDTQLMRELFVAVVNNSGLTLRIRQLHGTQ